MKEILSKLSKVNNIKVKIKFLEKLSKEINKLNISTNDINEPYLLNVKLEVIIEHSYNPKFGDDRVCKCGHPYYRHFDTYDKMSPIGCKYCQCNGFKEKISDGINKYFDDLEKWENSFNCNECGCDKITDFVYERTVANGEVWHCKNCKTETIVGERPNQDNY